MGLFDFLKGHRKASQVTPTSGNTITPANLGTPNEGMASPNISSPNPSQPSSPQTPETTSQTQTPADTSDSPQA